MKGVKVTYRDGDICKKQAAAHSPRPRGAPLACAAPRRTRAFGARAAQVNGQMEIGSREVTYQIQCDPSQARRLPPPRAASRDAAVVRRCPRVTSDAVVTRGGRRTWACSSISRRFPCASTRSSSSRSTDAPSAPSAGAPSPTPTPTGQHVDASPQPRHASLSTYLYPSNVLPRSGHGWFTVFLILFGAALYLSIGIGLNRYKYGMQASRPFRRLCPHPGAPRTRPLLDSTHPPHHHQHQHHPHLPLISIRHVGGRVDTAPRVLAAAAGPRP